MMSLLDLFRSRQKPRNGFCLFRLIVGTVCACLLLLCALMWTRSRLEYLVLEIIFYYVSSYVRWLTDMSLDLHTETRVKLVYMHPFHISHRYSTHFIQSMSWAIIMCSLCVEHSSYSVYVLDIYYIQSMCWTFIIQSMCWIIYICSICVGHPLHLVLVHVLDTCLNLEYDTYTYIGWTWHLCGFWHDMVFEFWDGLVFFILL